MTWNEDLPEWQNEGVEPPAAKKTEGWETDEKPPAGWFNWFFSRVYKALKEVREKLQPVALSGKYEDLTDKPDTFSATPHKLGSEKHQVDTLANLNAKISNATLDDKDDKRTPKEHGNEAHKVNYITDTHKHGLGSSYHNNSTLAQLNSKLIDATLDDIGGTRVPKVHGDEAHSVSYLPKNNPITPGTGTKLTFDKNGLILSHSALSVTDIPNLSASKITSGEFAAARIPILAIAKVDGLLDALNGKAANVVFSNTAAGLIKGSTTNLKVKALSDGTAEISGLNDALGSKVDKNDPITPGTGTKLTFDAKGLVVSHGNLVAGDIPNLDAGKVTTGVFGTARIPTLDAGKITTGTFSTLRIPNLAISKITNLQTSLDAKLTATTAQFNNKADKSYVDSAIQSAIIDSWNGVY